LSKNESQPIIQAFGKNWEKFSSIVDIGGGHGNLLALILKEAPKATGIVLELAQVVSEARENKTLENLGVSDRCTHTSGSMFEAADIPKGKDLYTLKRILHDWNDSECHKILRNISVNAARHSQVIVIDAVVPTSPVGQPHISKLMDVHMMCWGNGKERTQPEFQSLFQQSGWELQQIIPIGMSGLSLVIGKIPQ